MSPLRGLWSWGFASRGLTPTATLLRRSAARSEVALFLLLLHRARLVRIDQPSLPLRERRQQHLLNNLGQRRRIGIDRARQRITAEGPEANPAHFRLLARLERQSVVVDHDHRAVAPDDGALLSEVERDDGDL